MSTVVLVDHEPIVRDVVVRDLEREGVTALGEESDRLTWLDPRC